MPKGHLSFVILVKFDDYLIDPNKFSSYTPAHMANLKSAIKKIRRISKQTIVNKARKSRYKNALKKMNLLIEGKKKAEAQPPISASSAFFSTTCSRPETP